VIDVLDLHLHSHFSIAASNRMTVDNILTFAKIKGITIIGTGDVLFNPWKLELEKNLEQEGNGFYLFDKIRFILSSEINLIFEKCDKLRKIHLVLTFPSIKSVEKSRNLLRKFGNLETSSRPNIFIGGRQLVSILKNVDDDIQIIPAHIFTPWFGILGSKSGFDAIEDCFEENTDKIFAVETGLSADPAMCYRINSLRNFTTISNSDAHSPDQIGREATIFKDIKSYEDLFSVIKNYTPERFLFTLEYFPEEGKYFADGHRKCNFSVLPDSTSHLNCSVCGKPLTYGVFHRLLELSESSYKNTLSKIKYFHTIPLKGIISQVIHKSNKSLAVDREYKKAINIFKNEINILLFAKESDLISSLPIEIAEGIISIRNEKVIKLPGFDGEYGKIILNYS
jgi:uncharacterized protein (TIGR00375 family)